MPLLIHWRCPFFSKTSGLNSVSSLWPSDAIWQQRCWSTVIQAMAWCPRAPSHYLNKCWHWPLGTNFNEILTEIQTSSLKKIHWKIVPAKCQPFCLNLNMLTFSINHMQWLCHIQKWTKQYRPQMAIKFVVWHSWKQKQKTTPPPTHTHTHTKKKKKKKHFSIQP